MSAYYNVGEVKSRPGVYRRITNIGKSTNQSSGHTTVPDKPVTPYLTVSGDGVALYSGAAPSLNEEGVLVFSAVPSVTDGILHF